MSITLDTIYNEECSEGMKRIPDEFVDLTVTSPPYDNLRTYNGFSFDYKSVIRQLYRVTKRGGWLFGLFLTEQKTVRKQAHLSGKHYSQWNADLICTTQ